MTDQDSAGIAVGKDDGIAQSLSGSAGIARAVIDAGARVAASYPGGPVTAVVDKMIDLADASNLYVEWSNCEKVALTGFQYRTEGGTTVMGEQVRPIYPEKVVGALGLANVYTLDAFDGKAIRQTLQEVFNRKGLAFLVVRGCCPYIETRKCEAKDD